MAVPAAGSAQSLMTQSGPPVVLANGQRVVRSLSCPRLTFANLISLKAVLASWGKWMQFDQLNSARSSVLPAVSRAWSCAVRVCLIAITLAFAFAPIVHAADPSEKDSSSALWAAVITGAVTMIGLILQLGYNAREARRVEKTTAEQEQKQRQRELALKIADLAGKDRAAARRFAIGLVKIEKVGDTPEENAQ
jgi:hypothetical protein